MADKDNIMSNNRHIPFVDINANKDVIIQTIHPGSVPLSLFYIKTLRGDYESAGVGIASDAGGDITINLPPGSVIENAFLYFEVEFITNEGPPALSGTLNGQSIVSLAQPLGTSVFNIFSSRVYRADVTGIAQPGVNTLAGFPSSWPRYPFTSGASLVVVYSNPSFPFRTVVINDGAVLFDRQTVDTTIENFYASGAPVNAKTTYIVGLGDDFPDNALFNAQLVAGPNAFHGADGDYWDNLTIDVSNLVNPGDTSVIASIEDMSDILNYIAQVFSVTVPEPIRGIDISKSNPI